MVQLYHLFFLAKKRRHGKGATSKYPVKIFLTVSLEWQATAHSSVEILGTIFYEFIPHLFHKVLNKILYLDSWIVLFHTEICFR